MSERKSRARNKEPGARRNKAKAEEAEKPPAADLSAPTELPTANSKLQTEQMEVHHHPNLHHEKKPWKEYLLEFLMIFLAVTMGFFAETIRENISESGKGRELAKSLYQEAYADSITMHEKIEMRMLKESQMEYFRRYVTDSSLTHLSEKFYPAFVWSFIVITSNLFEPNDGMLSLLRNSGSLRYFKSVELQNCISNITVTISKLRERNSQELQFVEQYTRPFMLRHYDFKWQDEYTHNGKLSIIEALAQTNFHAKTTPFLKHPGDFNRQDAEGLAAYYLLITRASRQIFYQPYIEANHRLLQQLRKEYNFKDE